MRVLNCVDPAQRVRALTTAEKSTISSGGLVIFPTESAYVVGTDAFSPDAADDLRTFRGIGRKTPLPVLVKRTRRSTASRHRLPRRPESWRRPSGPAR